MAIKIITRIAYIVTYTKYYNNYIWVLYHITTCACVYASRYTYVKIKYTCISKNTVLKFADILNFIY